MLGHPLTADRAEIPRTNRTAGHHRSDHQHADYAEANREYDPRCHDGFLLGAPGCLAVKAGNDREKIHIETGRLPTCSERNWEIAQKLIA